MASKAQTFSTELVAGAGTGTGATAWITPERRTGYLVGGIRGGLCYDRLDGKPLTVAHIIEWVREIVDHPKGVDTVGSWVDTNGDIYIDASTHYADREIALIVAAHRGELAIWDIANAREIRVPADTGHHLP